MAIIVQINCVMGLDLMCVGLNAEGPGEAFVSCERNDLVWEEKLCPGKNYPETVVCVRMDETSVLEGHTDWAPDIARFAWQRLTENRQLL